MVELWYMRMSMRIRMRMHGRSTTYSNTKQLDYNQLVARAIKRGVMTWVKQKDIVACNSHMAVDA